MKFDGKGSARPLKSVMKELMQEFGWEDDYTKSRISEKWKEIVGDRIAEVAVIDKFENRILFIKTSSSIWRSELFLRRGSIKDKINEEFGSEIIKDIIIK